MAPERSARERPRSSTVETSDSDQRRSVSFSLPRHYAPSENDESKDGVVVPIEGVVVGVAEHSMRESFDEELKDDEWEDHQDEDEAEVRSPLAAAEKSTSFEFVAAEKKRALAKGVSWQRQASWHKTLESYRIAQKAAKKAGYIGRFTIDPMRSEFTNVCDALLSLAVVYTAVVTPAEVAFLGDTRLNYLFFINQVVNLIFIQDVGLQFFLHYQLANDAWVREHPKIVRHYLCGWFLIDFVASFPFDIISLLASSNSSFVTELQAARLLRTLRLLKLLRVFRSSRLAHKYRANFSFSFWFMNVTFFAVITILACHWTACAWGVVGNASRRENSWMAQFDSDDVKWSINAPKNQYLISLYFAIMTLTTVGYGDVNPKNLSEYALLVVCMLLGGFLWAYIIGVVCGTVANLDQIKIRHQQRFDQVNTLLVRMLISGRLAHRVRAYLFQTEEVDRHVAYVGLIAHLSPGLQQQLCAQLLKTNVGLVHYFTNRASKFQLAIFKQFETVLFPPEESIETLDLVVIVNNGVVQYYSDRWRICLRGDAINHDFLLRIPRTVPSICVLTYTEVNMLSREALEAVVEEFPAERTVFLWMRVFYELRNRFRARGRDGVLDLRRRHRGPRAGAPALVDDLAGGLDAAQDGDLGACSDRLRDTDMLVEIAISKNPAAFEFASPRLRASPALVELAQRQAGASWRTTVLPHVAEPLRSLLVQVMAHEASGSRAVASRYSRRSSRSLGY